MDQHLTRRTQAQQDKNNKTTKRKLRPGWKLDQSKREKDKAAAMIQRVYRSHMLRQAFRRFRHDVRFTFNSLRAFGKARSRQHWRSVDLRKLPREELRLLALTLNLPSTGKKVLLICRIQRWVNQHVLISNLAAQAATRAIENRRKAQGSVYFCKAHCGADLVNIRPLQGRSITSIAAGFESDAVYALDSARGEAWLCRTGGSASQVGLCSHTHRRDEFESTPHESHWLATPVFLHTLRAEHVERVYVARDHAMALTRAGDFFSWGDNAHGVLGFVAESAAQVARNRATAVGALSNYQAVAAAVGGHHSVAVCDHVAGHHGVVFCWGSNSHGQLGIGPSHGTNSQMTFNRPAKSSPTTFPRAVVMHQVAALRSVSVRQVACGVLHSLALTSDGKIYSWGCNDGGRLGQGQATKRSSDISEPALVNGMLSSLVVLVIACGAWHSACIAAEASQVGEGAGRVFTWGTGAYGQLGAGTTHVTYEPQFVRLPPREIDDEVLSTSISCGTHHTAALMVDNRIFTWGSTRACSTVPIELQLSGERFGRIASLACGRTFTVFNTVPRDAASYEWPEVPRLWRDKPVVIPRLDLSKMPTLPPHTLSPSRKGMKFSSEVPVRLEPFADRCIRGEEEVRNAKRIDDVDIEAIVHPLCRLCWRCNGFQPSPLRLWTCRNCSHERHFHGVRRPGVSMGEYEAVRKLQCLYRARRARWMLQQAREQRYQRIFSIAHKEFFYFNLWQGIKSWTRPVGLSVDYEVPIRDPDASPRISPPLTPTEAAVRLQAITRGFRARRLTLQLLRDRYEKHFDLKNERIYHVRKPEIGKVGRKEALTKLWNPPPLLLKLYDLGEPVEIQRLARFANMMPDEAARIVQHAYRLHRGREFMRRILRSRIKKVWDEKTERYYYYNSVTKESSWEKPLLLRRDEDEDKSPSADHRRANRSTQKRRQKVRTLRPEKFRNEEAAACTIQALYRRFATRKMLLELLSRRFRKLLDPLSGQNYYYDSVANTATWFKPAVLGDYDLELFDDSAASVSGRQRSTLVSSQSSVLLNVITMPRISERARIKRHKRRLQRLRQMSRDEVASRLQRMWRARRAKEKLRDLLCDTYEKIFDPASNHFYYYNRKTGSARWEQPSREIKETKVIKRRRPYPVTESNEAKQLLLTFMRCAVARLELHRLLRMRIQKIFDPESRQYYYFDKLTGQSSWNKPVALKEYDLPPE